MKRFEYAPLGVSGWSIRLVTLLPGSFDDDLRITLAHGRLSPPPSASSSMSHNPGDGEQEEPQDYVDGQFTALSYVWGTTEDPRHISVQTEGGSLGSLAVTQNLEEALRYLRYPQQSRVLWIDAIGINQEDLDERSRQVTFMGRLYNKARDVVVWLGPERDDGEFALKVLKRWGDHISVNWADSTVTELEVSQDPTGNEVEDAIPESMRARQLNHRETWALYHLMNREWFERLWVRQEVLTNTPTSFCLGNVAFDKVALMRAIFMMQYNNIWFDLPVTETFRFLHRRQLLHDLTVSTAGSRPLERLRYDLVGLKWGQPVDAIYASLNLFTEVEQNLKIVPDYTLPVAIVFQDVATQLIQYTEKLTLLHTCELASKALPDLPSWVPDWSSQIKVARFDDFWSASAFISGIFSVEKSNTLRVAGIRKATVRTVHDLVIHPQSSEPLFLRIAEHMKQLLPENLSLSYIGGGDLCEAYAKTFAADYCRERYSQETDKIPLTHAKEFISDLKALPTTGDITTFLRSTTRPGLGSYLNAAMTLFRGRSFIITEEGYIALAPQDTQPGDVITVILGSRLPVILRPVASSPTQPDIGGVTENEPPRETWQVVGCCYMPGLMKGEAIYGDVPEYLLPVSTVIKTNLQMLGLKDTRTGEVNSDPAAILADFGIQPVTVLHNPWRMHVEIDTLTKKGIAVEMLDIV